MSYDTTYEGKSQEGLSDHYDWRLNKLKTYRLSKLYELAGYPDRSKRVAYCCTYLSFETTEKGRRYLSHANCCMDRLCPICTSRTAKRRAGDLSDILDLVEGEHPGVQYIFLTLTIRNIKGDELRDAIGQMMRAWTKLKKHRDFERAIKGWFRSVEVTRNREDRTYHPHIHAVLAVEPQYFAKSSGLYLTHTWYKEHWQKAIGVDYDPRVQIEKTYKRSVDSADRVHEPAYAAALEAAKYPLKDKDYIPSDLPEDEAATVVGTYAEALRGRRFTAYGGWLANAAKALKIQDPDDMAVTSLLDRKYRDDITLVIEHYHWSFGDQRYMLLDRQDIPEMGQAMPAPDPEPTWTQAEISGMPAIDRHPR